MEAYKLVNNFTSELRNAIIDSGKGEEGDFRTLARFNSAYITVHHCREKLLEPILRDSVNANLDAITTQRIVESINPERLLECEKLASEMIALHTQLEGLFTKHKAKLSTPSQNFYVVVKEME
jgi:hypothetical protein